VFLTVNSFRVFEDYVYKSIVCIIPMQMTIVCTLHKYCKYCTGMLDAQGLLADVVSNFLLYRYLPGIGYRLAVSLESLVVCVMARGAKLCCTVCAKVCWWVGRGGFYFIT
jgi:hypothetical protein